MYHDYTELVRAMDEERHATPRACDVRAVSPDLRAALARRLRQLADRLDHRPALPTGPGQIAVR